MPKSDLIALKSVSVAQLAERLDVNPRDVLDDLIAAGVRAFWHEGQKFRSVAELQAFLTRYHLLDPIRDLEVDLSATQATELANDWGLSLEWAEFASAATLPANPAKPLRKFVGSEAELPVVASQRLG